MIAFLHEYTAGIRPLAPGYAEVEIRPFPDERIGWAEASLRTVHGELSSSWTLDGDQFRLVTRIPDGVDAIVRLPDGSVERVVGGVHSYAMTV